MASFSLSAGSFYFVVSYEYIGRCGLDYCTTIVKCEGNLKPSSKLAEVVEVINDYFGRNIIKNIHKVYDFKFLSGNTTVNDATFLIEGDNE